MSEELYPIKGYEGRYSITKTGKVFSHTRKQGFLKSYARKNKYEIVTISGKSYSVHRLVMLTFMPIPFDDAQVNHINGIKTDNRVENLEWVSAKDNTNHAIDNGLRDRLPPNSKITQEIANKIRELFNKGFRQCDLGRMFSIDKHCVYKVIHNKTYTN